MITPTDKKHPYTKELQNTLNVAKTKCECLQKRLDLIEKKYFTKHLFSFFISPYARNEATLLKISTQNELAALKRVIKEKELYFIDYMKQYVEDMEEVESNFERVVAEANEKAKTNETLRVFLSKIIWENLEKNTEAKIYFYKQIKKQLK
jgi:hypothetical protein